MKQRPLNHIALSLLFLFFLSSPVGVTLFSAHESVSKIEKRKLAPLPTLNYSLSSVQAFPALFDAYVEDHFGFRALMVRMHNFSMIKLFGISPSKLVVIGSDDWYFFNADGSIKDFLGGIRLGPRKLANTDYLLQDRKEWLDSIGTKYLFLPVPNKEMIYDDYLPTQIQQNRGVGIYHQILGYIQKNGSFRDYIDVEQLMIGNRDEMELFLRTDSHWNHDGTYLTYREIMRRIDAWYPDIDVLGKRDERKMVYDFSGDLSILMNLRGLITEDAPDVVVGEECVTRPLKRMDSLLELPEYHDLDAHRLPVQSGCSEQKYSAVMLHDSFGRFLRPYLSQQFETITYINHLGFEDAKAIIERLKPDVVIEQRVARNMLKSLRSDGDLQQIVLSNKFAELTDDHIMLNGSDIISNVVVMGSGSVSEREEGINFVVDNGTSGVSVAVDNPAQISGPAVFRIDISSSRDSHVRLCYQGKPDEITALASQCTKRELTQGENNLYFRVLHPVQRARLEINPKAIGDYQLTSIAVKNEHGR